MKDRMGAAEEGSSRMVVMDYGGSRQKALFRAGRIRGGFTLVELLIVVALLGALATLMLPNFKTKKKNSYRSIMQSEMHEIQLAFIRFNNDCIPTTDQLDVMTNVFFAALFDREITNSTPATCFSYEQFNPDIHRGWDGPYAMSEGQLTNVSGGQTYVFNAFFDPYGEPYRIVKSNSTFWIVATTNAQQKELLARQLTFE